MYLKILEGFPTSLKSSSYISISSDGCLTLLSSTKLSSGSGWQGWSWGWASLRGNIPLAIMVLLCALLAVMKRRSLFPASIWRRDHSSTSSSTSLGVHSPCCEPSNGTFSDSGLLFKQWYILYCSSTCLELMKVGLKFFLLGGFLWKIFITVVMFLF